MNLAIQQDFENSVLMPPSIRALLLDDNAFDRSRIRRYSEKSDLAIEVFEVPTIGEMAQMLRSREFDLIMIDFHLTEGNGLEAVDIVQRGSANRDAPIIMISGDRDSSTAISAFRNGCQNFVSKDELSPIVLQDVVLNALNHPNAARLADVHLSNQIQKQIHSALKTTLGSGAFEKAISDGIQQAANASANKKEADFSQEMHSFLANYWDEDEFVFRH